MLEHLHESSSLLTLKIIHKLVTIICLSVNMDTHSHIHIVHSLEDPFKPLCGFILWYVHDHMTTTMVWECEQSLATAVLEWMVATPWPTSVSDYSHTSRPRSYQTNSLIMEQEVTFSLDCPLCAIQTSTNCNGNAHCSNSELKDLLYSV